MQLRTNQDIPAIPFVGTFYAKLYTSEKQLQCDWGHEGGDDAPPLLMPGEELPYGYTADSLWLGGVKVNAQKDSDLCV